MNEKEEILKELREKFEKEKKELGFKPSFEEVEKYFSIQDAVLINGFVSENFSRQLCSRIVEHFREWHGYLNNLLIPNSSFYASQTESKLFKSEEDKKKIWNLINISMKFSSFYSLIGLSEDKGKEREFIDSAYDSWVNVFNPTLLEILSKVHNSWSE